MSHIVPMFTIFTPNPIIQYLPKPIIQYLLQTLLSNIDPNHHCPIFTPTPIPRPQLKTKRKVYVWNKRESADLGTPLLDLIEFGVTRANYASDVLGALLSELRFETHLNRFAVFE